jgi:hypothetical protein
VNRALRFTLLGLAAASAIAATGCGGREETQTLSQWAEKVCNTMGAWQRGDIETIVDPFTDVMTRSAGLTKSEALDRAAKGRRLIQQLSADLEQLRPTEVDDAWRDAQLNIDGRIGFLNSVLAQLARDEMRLKQVSEDNKDMLTPRIAEIESELEEAKNTVSVWVGHMDLSATGELGKVFGSVPACSA